MVEPAFGFGGSNRTCIWDLWLSFFFLSLLGFVFPCCFGMQVGGGRFFIPSEAYYIGGKGDRFRAFFERTKVRGFPYTFMTLRLSPRTRTTQKKTARGMSWEPV